MKLPSFLKSSVNLNDTVDENLCTHKEDYKDKICDDITEVFESNIFHRMVSGLIRDAETNKDTKYTPNRSALTVEDSDNIINTIQELEKKESPFDGIYIYHKKISQIRQLLYLIEENSLIKDNINKRYWSITPKNKDTWHGKEKSLEKFNKITNPDIIITEIKNLLNRYEENSISKEYKIDFETERSLKIFFDIRNKNWNEEYERKREIYDEIKNWKDRHHEVFTDWEKYILTTNRNIDTACNITSLLKVKKDYSDSDQTDHHRDRLYLWMKLSERWKNYWWNHKQLMLSRYTETLEEDYEGDTELEHIEDIVTKK